MSTTSLGQTGSANAITINNANGNVGIGTTTPSTALQVAGTITATGYAGLPAATTSSAGVVQVDGTSITAASGVISTIPIVLPYISLEALQSATSTPTFTKDIGSSGWTVTQTAGQAVYLYVPSAGIYMIIVSGCMYHASSSLQSVFTLEAKNAAGTLLKSAVTLSQTAGNMWVTNSHHMIASLPTGGYITFTSTANLAPNGNNNIELTAHKIA